MSEIRMMYLLGTTYIFLCSINLDIYLIEFQEWCIPYAISEPYFARTLRKEQTQRQIQRWLKNKTKRKFIKNL